MPTTTIGLFFVGKDFPTRKAFSTHLDGETFILKLRVVDNQGPRRVEAYVVRWAGPEARGWWDANGPLKAGDPLSLELVNPRSFPGLHAPEIHADVVKCRLMPHRAAAAPAAPQAA